MILKLSAKHKDCSLLFYKTTAGKGLNLEIIRGILIAMKHIFLSEKEVLYHLF